MNILDNPFSYITYDPAWETLTVSGLPVWPTANTASPNPEHWGYLTRSMIIDENEKFTFEPKPEPNNDFEAPSDIQKCIEELLKE